MTADMVMSLIFGVSLGAIAPTVFIAKTMMARMLMDIRSFKNIEKRLDEVERKVREMEIEA